MEHRTVDTPPTRDKAPAKAKPGDFEPPLGTAQPIVIDPPEECPQISTSAPCPEIRDAEPQR